MKPILTHFEKPNPCNSCGDQWTGLYVFKNVTVCVDCAGKGVIVGGMFIQRSDGYWTIDENLATPI